MNTWARRAVVATVALVWAANVALAADDGGVHAFLSNVFGQAGGVVGAATPESHPVAAARIPTYGFATSYRRTASYKPLTIRRQEPKVVAVGPTKPARVSIYNDPTLRRGDAVMTSNGIRIFAGSRSWPYAKSDFVTLAEAHDLDRDTAKVLASLNSLPRT